MFLSVLRFPLTLFLRVLLCVGGAVEVWQRGGFCPGLEHGDALLFGKAIQLKVLPKVPTKPTLFVLSPLQPEGVAADTLADEVCLATDFSSQDGKMVLNTEAGRVNVSTENAVVSPTLNTFSYVGVSNESIYSCELHDAFSNNEQIGLCADLRPEKGKLNFYLLLMNGVRVVFTKVVAFSTMFTIRALLH